MRDHKPAIVVIDAMAGCLALHGLSQNNADDIEMLYSVLLRPFRTGDAALRLIDHVTKDRETRGRWPTGSQRKLGGADVGLSLDVIRSFSRGNTGLARIRVQKDRLGGMTRPCCAELTLASDPATGAITWSLSTPTATHEAGAANNWRPTGLMEKISRYLEEQPEPVSRNSIEKAKLGKQVTYIRDAIDALAADGYITESAGPRGSRLYQNTKPFTSSDLVPPRPDEHTPTSSDLVPSLQGTRSSDEDEVKHLFNTYSDEVN
jgi:hypothetical protein